MMFRKLTRATPLQTPAGASSTVSDNLLRKDHIEWRVLARDLARRCMPALVLGAAAALGLAAVALA